MGSWAILGGISPSFGYIPAVAGNENTKEYLVAWEYGGGIWVRPFSAEGWPTDPSVTLPGPSPITRLSSLGLWVIS